MFHRFILPCMMIALLLFGIWLQLAIAGYYDHVALPDVSMPTIALPDVSLQSPIIVK